MSKLQCLTKKELLHDHVKCPVCGLRSLEIGENRVYQTLCEHVSDPNNESPLRSTIICANPGCKAFQTGYWDFIEFSWFQLYTKKEFIHKSIQKVEKFGDQNFPGDILMPWWGLKDKLKYRKSIYVGKNWRYNLVNWIINTYLHVDYKLYKFFLKFGWDRKPWTTKQNKQDEENYLQKKFI